MATRRFCALPAAVSLGAIGSADPTPLGGDPVSGDTLRNQIVGNGFGAVETTPVDLAINIEVGEMLTELTGFTSTEVQDALSRLF